MLILCEPELRLRLNTDLVWSLGATSPRCNFPTQRLERLDENILGKTGKFQQLSRLCSRCRGTFSCCCYSSVASLHCYHPLHSCIVYHPLQLQFRAHPIKSHRPISEQGECAYEKTQWRNVEQISLAKHLRQKREVSTIIESKKVGLSFVAIPRSSN